MEKLKISVDEKGETTIFMDGKEVEGWRNIVFRDAWDEYPTHEISYLTQKASHKNKVQNQSVNINAPLDLKGLSKSIGEEINSKLKLDKGKL